MIVITPRDSSAPRIDRHALSSGRQARTGGASAMSVVPIPPITAAATPRARTGEAAAVSSATSSGPTMNVISCSDASSAYAAARSSASDEHPRPQRAQRRTDRRHQGARSSGTDGDGQERRIEQRESADGQQEGRKDQRPRQEDPRLAAPVDQPAGDRRSDRGRHEVRAGDRAGRRVAAAVLAHEQQQGQSDHPHRQARK